MVEVQYLLVDKATLESSVEVTDDSVTALYEQEKESLVPPEERQVAHILFERQPEMCPKKMQPTKRCRCFRS